MSGKNNTAPRKKKTMTTAQKRAAKNVAKNSVIIFWFTAVMLLALFVGRWVFAIAKGYEASFVELDASTPTAVSNMKGRTPGAQEAAELLPLQKEWDLYTSSRLRDEVSMTASDGAELHGCLYDEGASVTVVVLPRFAEDGTADFLPGVTLNALTGCNILMPDPRCHGESGGEYFTYGLTEKYDLADWLAWADGRLGEQTFILWGVGTGANTALMAAAEGLLPASVAFIAAESPYDSLHELANSNIWKFYSVPSFPFLNAIEGRVARKAGFSVKEVDMTAVLAGGTPQVPVLFLTSEYDSYIPAARSGAVIDAWSGPKELVTGGGSHGTVYAAQRDEIDALLAQWWAAYGK